MIKFHCNLSLLKIILVVNGVLIVFYGEKDSISRPTCEETGEQVRCGNGDLRLRPCRVDPKYKINGARRKLWRPENENSFAVCQTIREIIKNLPKKFSTWSYLPGEILINLTPDRKCFSPSPDCVFTQTTSTSISMVFN